MSYQERKISVNMISSLLIFGGYSIYILEKYREAGESVAHDLKFWATAFLIFIPVSIVAQILIQIIFTIINKITTNEEQPSFLDERDKLIELKSINISHWVFTLGFLLAMVSVVLGMSASVMFMILAASGLVSSTAHDVTSLILYRRGF